MPSVLLGLLMLPAGRNWLPSRCRRRRILAKAERQEKFAKERGWNTISMKKEFKTIYGDNVKRTGK